MNLFLDSFWRAAAYCLHPRVMLASLMPLVIMVILAFGLHHFFWDPAVQFMNGLLAGSGWLGSLLGRLESVGGMPIKNYLAPLLVLAASTPVVVVLSLVLVAVSMTPALLAMVARRRFPTLERRHGGSMLLSVLWSLGSTLLAFMALVVSMPLWLIPPLVLVLPPLIWGWLTYRVMAFDALADHAGKEERREIFRRHRNWLLGIGVLCGYLGAAPTLVWASGILFAAAFVVLVPLAIWIYTLVFAFSSLWFSHYCLAALEALRVEVAVATPQQLLPANGSPANSQSGASH